MQIFDTPLKDMLVLKPDVFTDERGFFFESFNQKKFEDAVGKSVSFVQDNQSCSRKNVLRGLHYQRTPHEQGKLIHCISGCIYDVAVDIRPTSATYGKWFGKYLSSETKEQLWIPEGFAHGFFTCSHEATIAYKVTSFYNPHAEVTIAWNDPTINISWPIGTQPILSPKDAIAPLLADCCAEAV